MASVQSACSCCGELRGEGICSHSHGWNPNAHTCPTTCVFGPVTPAFGLVTGRHFRCADHVAAHRPAKLHAGHRRGLGCQRPDDDLSRPVLDALRPVGCLQGCGYPANRDHRGPAVFRVVWVGPGVSHDRW